MWFHDSTAVSLKNLFLDRSLMVQARKFFALVGKYCFVVFLFVFVSLLSAILFLFNNIMSSSECKYPNMIGLLCLIYWEKTV